MELALSAKEPYNYFLLLRALFRSIGGGSHDLLYQEFLPLLPNLLQGNKWCLYCYLQNENYPNTFLTFIKTIKTEGTKWWLSGNLLSCSSNELSFREYKIGIFPLIVPSEIVRKYKSLQLKLNKLSFIYSLGLNSLQSGLHKQHMKDLFVELCLTVPVRLSSLLPYLPMLMDPLVSALNGSQTLVSQVRTKLIISI